MKACLIAICSPDMRSLNRVEIWSSPEWEQSRQLPDAYSFVAYQVEGPQPFAKLQEELIRIISDKRSRYHWLYLHYKAQREAEERVKAATTVARFRAQAGPEHSVMDEIECFVSQLRRAAGEQMKTQYPLSLSAAGLRAFIHTFNQHYFDV